jgi:hypothetical protein
MRSMALLLTAGRSRDPVGQTSVKQSAFVGCWQERQCPTSEVRETRTSEANLGSKGYRQNHDSNAVFDLKFLNELAANAAGNFKFAALARNQRSMPPT